MGAHATCDFKTGAVILQQPVSHEQMTQLLATGKTGLLDGFVSNKTKRKFKAFLVYDKKDRKVIFEFERARHGCPPRKRPGRADPGRAAAGPPRPSGAAHAYSTQGVPCAQRLRSCQ